MTSADSVIVVGSGIIGIACAHYLSNAGFHVTIVDKGTIARGCSHANCGFICPSHVLPLAAPGAIGRGLKTLFKPSAPFRIKPQLRRALFRWLWKFSGHCNTADMLASGTQLHRLLESSMTEYRRLFAENELQAEWKENGLLYLFQSHKGLAGFDEESKIIGEHFGIQSKRIVGDDLPEFDPAIRPGLAGAHFFAGDASVRPDKLNENWTQLLRRNDVIFVENCDIKRVIRERGKIVSLVSDCDELTADHYVFAMGAWSSHLEAELDCAIPVEPGKGYSITMDRPAVSPKHPMLLPDHGIGVSPFDSGFRLGSIMEFAGFDTSISERRVNYLRESANPYLTHPVNAENSRNWYGWRPMTCDGLPIIGQVPGLENGILATGHNMLGLTLAPVTGKLVSELLLRQEPHIDSTAFSPNRF